MATHWPGSGPTTIHRGTMGVENMSAAKVALDNREEYENGFARIVGKSAALQYVQNMVRLVAPSDATVLINGETGTGKEVFAHAIHDASPRRQNRFVAINCAAIPSALLESELFGHERGAFTGAVSQSMGRFQMADRGTLFLDEIGDLPLELPPKLLRVLQERQVECLGGTRPVQIDVRVVAATNQDLWRLVQERKFRADLYYRLNVFPLTLPPLRDRAEDIPALVQYFVQRFSAELGKTIQTIPPEVMDILKLNAWPGNVRELENFIKRAIITSTGSTLRLMLGDFNRMPCQGSPAAKRTFAEAQREHIVEVLRDTRWVLGGEDGAAAPLGMPRTTLVYKMRKLGIAREQGSKSFRSRLSGLSNLPAEFNPDRVELPLDGAGETVEHLLLPVGAM